MGYKAKKIVGIILIVALAVLAMGALVMYLWNWLIPQIFGGKEITFLQALGILLLARVLVGFGKGYGGGGKWNHKPNHSLTEEEKMKLKQKFMEKCGWGYKRDIHDKEESKENQ